ncbi:MAG: hypothetical protein J6T60_05760 [Bacteroidales bacterium]|nr:hypothetical protein [Bacteroidales bacterium]
MQTKILHIVIPIITALSILAASCGGRNDIPVPDPQASAYWWKTTWNPDSTELDFINQLKIKKIYMRFFDVAPDGNSNVPKPKATIQFQEPIIQGVKIIPTIFITESCMALDIDKLPKMLAYRVLQMCETNDIKGIDEIQIDCDWKQSSQDKYFQFLTDLRKILKDKNIRLSATIRLHQLRMTPPPVDYGVLMAYNTGNISTPPRRNPILSYDDAAPYLKSLKDYDLPLCAAYPDFNFQLLYNEGNLRAILYNEDTTDTTKFRRITDNEYESIATRLIVNNPEPGSSLTQINQGDKLLIYKAEYDEISNIKQTIDSLRPTMSAQSIIYDINTRNINNFTKEQYEKILHH